MKKKELHPLIPIIFLIISIVICSLSAKLAGLPLELQ